MRLALAIICALTLGACGGGSDKPARSAATGPAHAAAAAPPESLQAASCGDWMRVGDQGRHTLLGQLRAVRGEQVVGRGVRGYGTVLTDAQATQVLDARCSMHGAQYLRLYKLYSWAANFAGGAPQ
jgi:hypothetical protein